MQHLVFSDKDNSTFKVAVLIKTNYFKKEEIEKWYVNPIVNSGIAPEDIIAFDLEYPSTRVSASVAKKYLKTLLPALTKLGVSTLLVADATYFKTLTGLTKPESQIGYVHSCKIKDYEHINVCYGLNYAVFLRNPNQIPKLDMAMNTLTNFLNGKKSQLGEDVIHDATYIPDVNNQLLEFEAALNKLHNHPILTCDIETYGLDLQSAGLASIAFAWSIHDGMSAYIGYQRNGKKLASRIRILLKRFFEAYKGTLIFHNCTFDIKNLIFTLFMDHPLDKRGLLHGLHTLFRSTHDTKVIAYLATNSTAGNELGLKPLAYPYVGSYAEDVSDTAKIPVDNLLEYNLKDCLATYWVFEQYYPKMLQDDQREIYEELMMPSAKLITQMELHGMPMNMAQVERTEAELQKRVDEALETIQASTYVDKATHLLQVAELEKINAKLKTKKHGMEKVADLEFNPGSGKQLAVLLHDVLDLPILDTTPSGAPATGAGDIEKLLNHTDDDDVKELLTAIINLGKVNKILSTFIPAFKGAFPKGKWHYLHGSFNLGGTLSGRLSSSNPNLQNLPSGSTYGKDVKKCFSAPKGWVFVGADFASLIY